MKDYPVNKRNSTVCGYPGRDFDWSKFDWEGKSIHVDKCFRCEHKHENRAPKPWIDSGLIAENCEYLHVPFDWENQGTIYRVRPNPTMYAGEIYRGKLVKSQKAIKKSDGWYWRLIFGTKEGQ